MCECMMLLCGNGRDLIASHHSLPILTAYIYRQAGTKYSRILHLFSSGRFQEQPDLKYSCHMCAMIHALMIGMQELSWQKGQREL